MTGRAVAAPLVLVALVLGACAAPGLDVPPADILPEGVEIARFGDARALAGDGAGRLYVADAAVSAVVVLRASGSVLDGAVLDRLGGTDDAPFLDVADVDPTNGQAVFVADAGTGRVVRFTAEGRAAETLSVPSLDAAASLPLREADAAETRTGRPVAVAAGPGNVVYALDAERGVVLRWDADRTLDRVIGGPASPRPLQAPTGLVVTDDGDVVVADGGHLVVFDAFGAVRYVVDAAALGRVGSVSLSGGQVLAVGPSGLAVLDEGALRGVSVEGRWVDAVVEGDGLYLLTPTRLVRVPAARLGAQ